MGLKYRMICVDLQTGSRVLMDNHRPKGPHLHVDDAEVPYQFVSKEQLISDFKELVFEWMGIKL